MTGDAPFLTNLLSAPFFDLRALPAPGAFAVRLNGGFIQGPTPAMAFGAVAAPTLVIINGAVASGMITGGAPGQTLGFFQGATGELDRQNLWLGSITNGTPAANGNNGRGKAIPHMWVFPAAVNQVAPIPAPAVDVIYTTTTGLGFNAAFTTNPSAAPPGPQPLPIIRAAAPPTGSNSVAAGGAPNGTVDSTGSTITFINRGVGITTLAPAGTDTIDGLAASITIPSGGARTLMSDGVSNWSVISIADPKPAVGRFDPVVGVDVTVSQQSGQFTNPGVYVAVGVYTISLNVLPYVPGAGHVIWTGNAFTPGHILTVQAGFGGGQATVGVRIVDPAGTPVEDSFFLHADCI
jgi:hypothetical protein